MRDGTASQHRLTFLVMAGLAGVAWAAACGDGAVEPAPREPARPASITIEPESASLTHLGETSLFRATVRDQYGAAFSGTVTWSSSDESVFTIDAGGTVTAVANGSGTVTATFQSLNATGVVQVAQAPAAVETASGDGQKERLGGVLPEPVVVRVADAGGSPVEGATVVFAPGEGHGTVDPAEVVSDTAGLAGTTWVLGAVRGEQTLTASVAAATGLSVVATATALTPSDQVRVIEVVAGGGQSANPGAALRDPVVVRALDAGGSPVEGAIVVFAPDEGHGTANPREAMTDTLGMTQTQWTLGSTVGQQVLVAAVDEVSARIAATSVNPDRAALEAFYNATGGPGWKNSENWLTDAPLGQWHGVETNGAGRVVELVIGYNGLSGNIPPEVGELSGLETLTIVFEEGLTGSAVPPELGRLSNLKAMSLNGNGLSGGIPPELGRLAELELLGIAQNSLEGSIPPELGNLSALGALYLDENRLTGRIPNELGDLRLFNLSLEYNQLSGEIPADLGRNGTLETLHLTDNKLTGSIPPEIGDWPGLRELYLNNNDLMGRIPAELGQLQQLRALDLSRNRLTGGVPAELSGSRSLETLNLFGNAGMSGALPAELTALGLNTLLTAGTELCAPRDNEFQAWLATISNRHVGLCAPGGTVAYLTQAVQSLEFPVSLVAGEDALLRVFVTAVSAGEARIPPMRATFFHDGRETYVAEVSGQATAIPAEIDEGNLDASGNAVIPGSVIVPGLEMVVEVDPGRTLDPALEIQTRLPETGRLAVDVKAVPTFELVVVPFLRRNEPDTSIISITSQLSADHELFEMTRTLLPVNDMDVSIHEPVWTSSTTASGMLEELRVLTLAAGGTKYYLGTTHPGVGGGLAFGAWRVAIADLEDWVVAHELGHTMSLQHAPCGGVLGVDPLYPYSDGATGAWGYDFRSAALVPPETPELMGYCGSEWISDYHFNKAIGDRLTHESGASAAAAPEQSLLLWGGANAAGEPFLEPSFVLDAPRALPERGGAHRIAGLDERGNELFSLSFDMHEAADGDGSSSFAFVLPTRPEWEGRLVAVTLTGPGGAATIDAGHGPAAALLREPLTGQVRGILRDWSADLGDAAFGPSGRMSSFDVEVSHGIPDLLSRRERR